MGADEVQWLDADQQASWRAFIMGQTLLLDRLDRDLRQAHGISLTEYEVLVRLSEQPRNRLRMALLADAMCHSRSRVTHTIGRMERMDLVERVAADGDGRGVEAVMTRAGQRLLKDAAPMHVRSVRDNLIDLASPEDFAALGRIFDAVSDRLLVGHAEAADIR
ncbi:MAG: MarR family transcriptional regulator [Myxococcales bacterium]|nr:MAG: MarR family transcriptional regulator [Myxococcales bacterium]